MSIVAWPVGVNQKAYSLSSSAVDNTSKVDFKGGNTVYYLKNTSPKQKNTFKLWFDDQKVTEGLTEFGRFWFWYQYVLCGSANTFWFLDPKSRTKDFKEYRIVDPPSFEGQGHKEGSLTIQEE